MHSNSSQGRTQRPEWTPYAQQGIWRDRDPPLKKGGISLSYQSTGKKTHTIGGFKLCCHTSGYLLEFSQGLEVLMQLFPFPLPSSDSTSGSRENGTVYISNAHWQCRQKQGQGEHTCSRYDILALDTPIYASTKSSSPTKVILVRYSCRFTLLMPLLSLATSFAWLQPGANLEDFWSAWPRLAATQKILGKFQSCHQLSHLIIFD